MGNTIIQFRNDTAANWTSNNPILALGEMGLETNTNKFKFGDGSTAWNSLGYVNTGGSFKYGLYTLSANQTSNFAAGNHIEFDTCQGSLGGLSTGSGQQKGIVTLAGGKTYKITAMLATSCSSPGWGNTRIYNRTSSTFCGFAKGNLTVNLGSSECPASHTMAILSPETDINIDFRIEDTSGTWVLAYPAGTWMLIEEYGGY